MPAGDQRQCEDTSYKYQTKSSPANLIEKLCARGVVVNVTAVFTLAQVRQIVRVLNPEIPAIVSVFAGRIADTGIDPVPLMKEALSMLSHHPKAELLWASPREVLNIFQANDAGCHIITVSSEILAKLKDVGKDLSRVLARDGQDVSSRCSFSPILHRNSHADGCCPYCINRLSGEAIVANILAGQEWVEVQMMDEQLYQHDVIGSIVAYKSNPAELEQAIRSFVNTTLRVKMLVVDNSPTEILGPVCRRLGTEYLYTGRNCGFGAGHNIAIRKTSTAKYHLVLNPDVQFEPKDSGGTRYVSGVE